MPFAPVLVQSVSVISGIKSLFIIIHSMVVEYSDYMHEIANNVFGPGGIPATAFAATSDTTICSTNPADRASRASRVSRAAIPANPAIPAINTTVVLIPFTATSDHPYEFECLRCSDKGGPKRWNRRDPLSTRRPECCPRCKSPSWDKPKQRRSKIPAAVLAAVAFTDSDWAQIAGSIVETVHLIPEDDIEEALVAKLKRYFGGNLSTC